MKERISQIFTEATVAGQSLVETAVFMPIILILLAGVVEVGNLLVTQNRVSTAARVATGFGASHYRTDYDWTAKDPVTNELVWAQEMAQAATNNVTQTLDLDPQRWDIWTIRATLYNDKDQDVWEAVSAYGNRQVVSQAEWDALEPGVHDDVRDALELSDDGLGVIATVAYHDRSSVLGLNAFNFGELTRLRGLNVMRIDEEPNNSDAAAACNVIPIAIQYEQYSLYPSNWYNQAANRPRINPSEYTSADYPGDPVNLYPPDVNASQGGFEKPKNKWENDAGVKWDYQDYSLPDPENYSLPRTHRFAANWPGIPIEFAERGFIYRARLVDGQGSFGWLDWDATDPSQTDLATSLDYPGDFATEYPGSIMDQGDPNTTYVTGDGDGVLETGEWVRVSTGNVNSDSVKEQLFVDYILPGKTVLMIVYDEASPAGGSNKDFKVVGFATTRLLGFNFTGQQEDRYIVFEFLGWADECNEGD